MADLSESKKTDKKPAKKRIQGKRKPTKQNITGTKTKMGRPLSLEDPVILEKFKAAQRLDANIEASCAYAGIAVKTYYNHVDRKPEFLQEMQIIRKDPYLKALNAVVEHLSKDPEFALKYLERRARNEFSTQNNVVAQVETSNKYQDLPAEDIARMKDNLKKSLSKK